MKRLRPLFSLSGAQSPAMFFFTVLFLLVLRPILPAATEYSVTNSGSSHYVIDGENDPPLTLLRGEHYTFSLNAPGHPFWIKTAPVTGEGSGYGSGVTGNGSSVGTLTFLVPLDAPDTLYYICQFHGGMTGSLLIEDPPGAVTYYVDASNGEDSRNARSWAEATETIQAAVDLAAAGDRVIVTNGTYAVGSRPAADSTLPNRVMIAKGIDLQSVNGPDHTIIQGAGPVGVDAVRCVWMTNGASLVGFTLTQGATQASPSSDSDARGGGLFALSADAVVSNCVLSANFADSFGGGAWGSTLQDCRLISNRVDLGQGGGAASAILEDCEVLENTAAVAGGLYLCTARRSRLIGNTATIQHAGGAQGSHLTNCLLSGNQVTGGTGAAAYGGSLNHCTVVGNDAGLFGAGVALASVTNSIIYFNPIGGASSNNFETLTSIQHSCTFPMPAGGSGNITNAPALVNVEGGDLQLSALSPCRDLADTDQTGAGTDLAGAPRVVHRYADMGAYEYQGGTQQGDFDEDGMGNGDENVAGTDFNDPRDRFRLEAPASPSPSGAIAFSTLTGRLYAIDYNEDLVVVPQAWTEWTNNIPGTGEQLRLVDPAASSNRHYRVRVRLAP